MSPMLALPTCVESPGQSIPYQRPTQRASETLMTGWYAPLLNAGAEHRARRAASVDAAASPHSRHVSYPSRARPIAYSSPHLQQCTMFPLTFHSPLLLYLIHYTSVSYVLQTCETQTCVFGAPLWGFPRTHTPARTQSTNPAPERRRTFSIPDGL